jgi:inosose dehydratase
MKLSGSNYGMPNLSLDQALAFHAEVGYRAIEITVLPNYATALERFDAAERHRLREQLPRHGLVCSGIANFQDLTDPDAVTTKPILARHRGAIDLAAELATDGHGPVVAFYSGGTTNDWPAARERLVARIADLAQYAERRGVVLAMKAHALGCVSRPHQLVDLFEQIRSPSFRFCFDMSHFEVQGLSIEQALYPLLPLSAHVEIKASIGRAPHQEYMIPGEANVQSDFVGQFRAMKKLGYQGYLVPEMSVHVMRRPNYDPYAALRLAYTALTRVLREASEPDSEGG